MAEEFELDLVIWANGQEVDSASARLNFDPNVLEVLGFNNDGSPFDTVLQSEFDNAAGTIDYQAGKLGGPFPSNQFLMVSIRIRALTSAGTEVTFNTTAPRESMVVRTAENVLDETSNAQIVVGSGEPSPTSTPLPPTEMPTEIPTETPTERPTDVPTETPLPPTNTPVSTPAPTNTAAATNTPVAPTPSPAATPTPTAVAPLPADDVYLPLVSRP